MQFTELAEADNVIKDVFQQTFQHGYQEHIYISLGVLAWLGVGATVIAIACLSCVIGKRGFRKKYLLYVYEAPLLYLYVHFLKIGRCACRRSSSRRI